MPPRRTLCFVLALLVFAAPVVATDWVMSHHEDFHTTDSMDADATTAVWDVAEGEIRFPDYPLPLVGSLNPAGHVMDAIPYGRYALQAAGSLHVVDLIDPANPVIVAVSSMTGAEGVAAAGRYAYVACGTNGVRIVDLGDPHVPVLAGSWGPSTGALNVAVAGNRLFIADTDHLEILDISDPTAPVLLPNFNRSCRDVVVDGHLAYLAAGSFDLMIVDISDAGSGPALVGHVAFDQHGEGIAISGNHVFVAAGSAGLMIFDVVDPTTPVLLGTGAVDEFASDVSVSGNYVYVTDEGAGLVVFDCLDPTAPRRLGGIAEVGTTSAVAGRGNQLLLSEAGSGLRLHRARSDLHQPIAGDAAYYTGDAVDLVQLGDLLYGACGDQGLLIVDVSLPLQPALVSQTAFDDPVVALDVASGRAYLATDGGLVVADVSDPAAPVEIGSYLGSCNDIVVSGTTAYVAAGLSGLRVLDVGDPDAIVLLDGQSVTNHVAEAVAVDGNHAVIACRGQENALFAYDVSDPTNVAMTGPVWNLANGPWSVLVSGSRVYFGDDLGIKSAHIEAATGHLIIDNGESFALTVDMALHGDILYGCGPFGTVAFDVTDPAMPDYVDAVAGGAKALAVAGDILFTADEDVSRIDALELYQGRYDLDADIAQSVSLIPPSYPLEAVRLSTDQTGEIDWGYNGTASYNWYPITPDNEFFRPLNPGSMPRFRARLGYEGGGIASSCTELTMEWLYRFAPITAVADIPDDQGGQVRLRWNQSGHDIVVAPEPVLEYAVYRLIDGSRGADKADEQGRRYPPGDWDYVTSVPASGEAVYATVVPTLADSSITGGQHFTTFFVRALTATPTVYWDSPPDSGYSVDNLAPNVPQQLVVAYNQPSGVRLDWEEAPEEDFRYFKIYRGDHADFEPLPENLVHESVAPAWTDDDGEGSHHYKVTAVDFAGNESDAAAASQVTDVGDAVVPRAWALHPCAPNPFNPATTVRFAVPRAGVVRIAVFDAAGRQVRSLLDGAVTAGDHAITWRGLDDAGRRVGSGIYFCRLVGDGFTASTKMTLVQ